MTSSEPIASNSALILKSKAKHFHYTTRLVGSLTHLVFDSRTPCHCMMKNHCFPACTNISLLTKFEHSIKIWLGQKSYSRLRLTKIRQYDLQNRAIMVDGISEFGGQMALIPWWQLRWTRRERPWNLVDWITARPLSAPKNLRNVPEFLIIAVTSAHQRVALCRPAPENIMLPLKISSGNRLYVTRVLIAQVQRQ